MKKVHW